MVHRKSGWFQQLRDMGAVIAPSGLVPKEGTRGRSIVDHHIVNAWWEKDEYREVYGETPSPLVQDTIAVIGWMGLSEELVVAKVDFAIAYKNVRIAPSLAHFLCLDLGTEFVGIPLVMTFRSRLAPIAFGVITSAVIWSRLVFVSHIHTKKRKREKEMGEEEVLDEVNEGGNESCLYPYLMFR